GANSVPDRNAMFLAVLFFAVFVVNQQSTWVFVPIPLIAAIVVSTLILLRDEAGLEWVRTTLASKALPNRATLIRETLDTATLSEHWTIVKVALAKQLDSGTISPADYELKL